MFISRLKKILSLSLFCLLFSNNAYPITLIPATAKIEGNPGEVKLHNIQFINDSAMSCSIDVKASEIDINDKGLKVFNSPLNKKNITKNLTLSPTNFILKSGESKIVSLNIKIPENLKGSDDAMIFFSASPIFKDKKTGNISKMSIETALGSLIMVYAQGTEIIKSRIKKAQIFPLKNKLQASLEVINEGNSHIEASCNIAIFDENEKYITSFNIPKRLICPSQSIEMSSELNAKLDKGKYHALITYQYHEDKNTVIDRPFEIK